jgi:aspartyl-tRNA(Asn)/glutamyl-tRNA(Gln) amidotransferase subunit A
MSVPSSDLSTRPITDLSTRELVTAYDAGQLSPIEVAHAVLDRIDAVQPHLNCFSHIDRDSALAAARDSEKRWKNGRPRGPIDGVPVTLKENVPTEGVAVTQASLAYAEAAPSTVNGPPATRTIESGAVIVGKTTMSEMGMLSSGVSSLHGVTRNPWNLGWTVGGSSGGAAAAAAAGCGTLHCGSDIGGSLRFPATWLGLATLKPTFGRLPVDPPYMGRCVGALARTVDDVALYSSVLAGSDLRDHTSVPIDSSWTDLDPAATGQWLSGAKIAYFTDGGSGLPTDPEVAALVTRAVAAFEEAGAEVVEIEPLVTEEMLDGLETFFSIRSWIDYSDLPYDRRIRVHPFIAEWAGRGADKSGADAVRAFQKIQAMAGAAVGKTASYDLVLSPVAPCPVFPAHWPHPLKDPSRAFDHLAYTAAYNFSGQPAASVNCGQTETGSFVGLQIAGRRFDDLGVLRAAKWYESIRPFDATPAWDDLTHRIIGWESGEAR